MNTPARQTNRSITRGATLALLALLTGIAVTSPAWLIGRAGEKHHGDKHHGIVYRWDLIHLTTQGTNTVLDAGGFDWDKAAVRTSPKTAPTVIPENVARVRVRLGL